VLLVCPQQPVAAQLLRHLSWNGHPSGGRADVCHQQETSSAPVSFVGHRLSHGSRVFLNIRVVKTNLPRVPPNRGVLGGKNRVHFGLAQHPLLNRRAGILPQHYDDDHKRGAFCRLVLRYSQPFSKSIGPRQKVVPPHHHPVHNLLHALKLDALRQQHDTHHYALSISFHSLPDWHRVLHSHADQVEADRHKQEAQEQSGVQEYNAVYLPAGDCF
jgi:hypothetical protein